MREKLMQDFQRMIDTVNRMTLENQKTIEETQRILDAHKDHDRDDLSRAETRVTRDDGYPGCPDRLKDADLGVHASVVDKDEVSMRIILSVTLGDRDRGSVHGAYTLTEDEPGVLRWMEDDSLVELSICRKMRWPDLTAQEEAIREEVLAEIRAAGEADNEWA